MPVDGPGRRPSDALRDRWATMEPRLQISFPGAFREPWSGGPGPRACRRQRYGAVTVSPRPLGALPCDASAWSLRGWRGAAAAGV